MDIKAGIKKLFGGSARCCEADELLAGVRRAYSAAATDPGRTHPFPVGKAFAQGVGYSPSLLDSLPAEAVDSFAGVGPVAGFAEIEPGARVLDIGCGAGLDSLLAARKSGVGGRVVGLDFSHAMLTQAMVAARRAGEGTILYCCGDAGHLPLATASVDVVLANGIFNLNPERQGLFREMARVLRPGGRAFAAELVFTQPQSAQGVRDINDWLS